MGTELRDSTGNMSRSDPSSRRVLFGSTVALAAVVALDLDDGQLGVLFSVGFILIVVTAALAVDRSGLFMAGFLPPSLMIGAIVAVATFSETALVRDGTPHSESTSAQVLAGLIYFSGSLIIGHGLALAAIGMRNMTIRAKD